MKADKFAVTKMKRRQIIELIYSIIIFFLIYCQIEVPKVPNENPIVLRVIKKTQFTATNTHA